MANIQKEKEKRALRRRRHVRRQVRGTAERPRLSVSRSLRNTTAQLIDDQRGVTLVFLNSKGLGGQGTKTEVAREVGRKIAALALEKGVKNVVFDRNRYIYHGRVKAVAEGAREGGLGI